MIEFVCLFVCLFELILYVPVNSNGHVGTLTSILWDFYPTLGCHDTQNVLHKYTNKAFMYDFFN